MLKKSLLILLLMAGGSCAWSQQTKSDSIHITVKDSTDIDDLDYDDLFSDLGLFLDSILAPRSYFLINLSAGQEYFSFTRKNSAKLDQVQKLVWSPAIGYYGKKGLGITLTGFAVDDETKFNVYQASLSPSYDYLRNRKLAAGISYTRYFTKDSLPFYTSPLQNELNGYFIWRKSWVQPGITIDYGKGSRTEYKKRETLYRRLLAAAVANGIIRNIDTIRFLRRTTETIADFSLTASARHDFYWRNIFSHKDYVRFTPMLSLSGGTQRFGFNQTTGATGTVRAKLLYTTRNVTVQQDFKLLSASLCLRGDYTIGKFFVQPQLLFDYYFPAKENNLTTLFSLNIGLMF